jgi:hypothetical protein
MKAFIDLVWDSRESTQQSMADLKIVIQSVDVLEHLMKQIDSPLDRMRNKSTAQDVADMLPGDEFMVVLRRTTGPTPGAIKWHTDILDCIERCDTTKPRRDPRRSTGILSPIPGAKHSPVHVLALNGSEEYDGGRMCTITGRRGLERIEREAGGMTVHNMQVVHAVTPLTRGNRYNMYVMSQNFNASGDGSTMVKLDSVDAVDSFLP